MEWLRRLRGGLETTPVETTEEATMKATIKSWNTHHASLQHAGSDVHFRPEDCLHPVNFSKLEKGSHVTYDFKDGKVTNVRLAK